MLTLDWMFFLVAGPAVVFAGISKGGFGSAASFAAPALLALILDPGLALGVMLPLLMLIDFSSLKAFWRKWSVPDSKVLIIGGLPGVATGAALYHVASADLLRILIGCVSVGFVLWQLALKGGLIRHAQREMPIWAGGFVGFVSGFTTFLSHAGGPPAAVYLLTRKLSKTQYQATTVLVFWVLNIGKFFPYAALGMFTTQTLLSNVILAPLAFLGTWLGVRAHYLVPERIFFSATYVLLLVTGSKLIWDGLT